MRVTAATPSRATAARCTWTWRRRARPWRGTAATPATPSRQTRTPGTAGQTASGADSRRSVHVRCLMYFYVFILYFQRNYFWKKLFWFLGLFSRWLVTPPPRCFCDIVVFNSPARGPLWRFWEKIRTVFRGIKVIVTKLEHWATGRAGTLASWYTLIAARHNILTIMWYLHFHPSTMIVT